MRETCMLAALTMVLLGVACGGGDRGDETPPASATAGQEDKTQVAFTEEDLDSFGRGLRREIDVVRAAQQKAASATTPQDRGEAMQAQWETATIPLGAEAAALPEPRYRDVREGVDRVFTTLDFQGKIDGPLSIDLERADPDTKARVSGDAFADLPPETARALRTKMDGLIPIWIEYEKLVAVAG